MSSSLRPGIAFAIALFASSACAHHDLTGPSSELRQLQEGEYEFKTVSDVMYPDGSEAAEQKRRSALNHILAENAYCPRGHTISDRRSIAKAGLIKDVYYRVKCLR